MQRLTIFIYGLIAYGLGMGALLYLVGFLAGVGVPRSINDGPASAWPIALLVNTALVALFALQHTIMARPGFKAKLLALGVPRAAERSTFVLMTAVIFALMFWQWRAMPGVLITIEHPVGRAVLSGISALGWGLAVFSTFLINHFDLFGLRQITLELRQRPYTDLVFVERSFYRVIRHPLLLGFVIAFWATPDLTVGHLVFALSMTTYILIGIRFEERDLIAAHGDAYRTYRNRTGALLPKRRKGRGLDVIPPLPPELEIQPDATTIIARDRG